MLISIFINFISLFTCVMLACMSVHHMHAWSSEGQKKASGPLEQDLVTVSYCVCAQVLC